MADPKIKYDIEAAVKGSDGVQALEKDLRDLGAVLDGDLKTQATAAADAIKALGEKQAAVTGLQQLKNETGALAIELAQAQSAVRQMGEQLSQASTSTQQYVRAEMDAKAALDAKRAQLLAARKAYDEVQAGTVGAARKTDEYRTAVDAAKGTVQKLSAEVRQESTALKEAQANVKTAQQAENALAAQYQKSSEALVRTRAELTEKNTALDATREKLRAMGVDTGNLTQAERSLAAAMDAARTQALGMVPAYQQVAAASTQSTAVQTQNQRTLREGMTSISTQLQRIQQIASVALGGSYAGGLIKDVADTADAFKNLEARIKLATGEGPLFQEAFRGVAEISLRTNSALDETGMLFIKLAKAGQEAGKNAEVAQREALALTETINQSVQLSGGSADSAKAAIVQLIQGLQSGVLRGEEFNSVMEQAPRLAQAMANGLGVTTGELRKLANQGALTAETVMGALRGQADVVAGEFAKLPPTVGRALQNLSTQWTLYVGSADSGMVSSANAAKVISALANNLDTLVTTLQTAGKLWAAIKIAGLASDFGAWALKTLSATTAVEANTVAVGANTVAQRSNSAAVAANAAAQAASTAATVANNSAKERNAASWAAMTTFAGQAAKATQAATAATVASTAAVAGKTAGMGLLGGALRGVMSLLGGPVGMIATLVLFSGEIKRGIAAVVEWGMSFTDAGKKLKQHEQALRDSESRQRAAAEAAKEHRAALERQAEALERARVKSFELSKEAVGLVAQFDKLRKDGDSAAEAIGKIGKDFDLSNVPGIKNAGAVLDMLVADGKLSASEFQAAWANALNGKDLAQFEALARAAFSGAAREGERVGQLLDATVREAVRRTGLDFEDLQGKISATSRSAINDVDAIINGLGRLKEQGVDTGRVLNASLSKAIDTADSERALEQVRMQIERVRTELGNKVADGLLEQAARKAEELRDKLDKATGGINSVAEAMGKLGMKSIESMRLAASEAQSAFDVIKAAGQQEGESFIAWQLRKQEAARTMLQRMIEANGGVADAATRARAAAEGLKLETDESGRTIVKSMRDARKSVEEVGDAAGRAGGRFRGMAQDAANAANAAKRLREINDRGRFDPGDPNKSEIDNLYDRNRMDSWEEGERKLNKARSNVSGNATLTKEYVDAQIAKRYGEKFIGDADAMEAFNVRLKLEAYRNNYGNVVRSQQSLNEQHALLQTLQRLEEKLNQRATQDGKKPASGESRPQEPVPPRPGRPGGVPTSAVAGATVVNLSYNGAQMGSVSTDASGREALQKFMDALTQARTTAR